MKLYKTENVDEAVALAQNFKNNGTYNWFRGQISNWPLRSSFVRLKAEQKDAALQKFGRFEHWVKHTAGLETLSPHADAIIAIAQHYGIPTNFVDFTTSPQTAGFFASYGRPQEGQDSCIICLDTADLKYFWRELATKYKPPEFLNLDVPNLWRLEAQSGTFLFCPYYNFEEIYDLDRIVFPYKGPVSKPTADQVYPRRKSNLEILLDRYFMKEAQIEGWHATHLFPNAQWVDSYPAKCDPDLIVGGSLPRDISWDPSKLCLWVTPKQEGYSNAITEENCEITIDESKEPNVIIKEISNYVKTFLISNSEVRSKLISWSCRFIRNSAIGSMQSNILAQSIQRLWDGVRTLPYHDDDIAIGIGSCIALYLCRQKVAPASDDPWLDAASLCFGKAIEVEFGVPDGSYSRGYISRSDLLGAVRDDISKFVVPAFQDEILGNMTGLLQAVQSPDRLFIFDRLASLFARQLAPSQVLVRQPPGAVFFSPANLNSFGLP